MHLPGACGQVSKEEKIRTARAKHRKLSSGAARINGIQIYVGVRACPAVVVWWPPRRMCCRSCAIRLERTHGELTGSVTASHSLSVSVMLSLPLSLSLLSCAQGPILALDKKHGWFPAKIASINYEKKTLKVHFNGWHKRFDFSVPFESNRLKPARIDLLATGASSVVAPV